VLTSGCGFPAQGKSARGRLAAERMGGPDGAVEQGSGGDVDAGEERRVAGGVEELVRKGSEELPVVPDANAGDDFVEELKPGRIGVGQELHESAQALEPDAEIVEVGFVEVRPAGQLAKEAGDGAAELENLRTGRCGRRSGCTGRRESGGKRVGVIGQIAAEPISMALESLVELGCGAVAQLVDAAEEVGKGILGRLRRELERIVAHDFQIAQLSGEFADGFDGAEKMARQRRTDDCQGLEASRGGAQLVDVIGRGGALDGFQLPAQLAERAFDGDRVHGDPFLQG